MNSTNQNKIASYAILNALERILILKELDKESVFNEYKEWIINDYKKETILFIREDPISKYLFLFLKINKFVFL